MLEDEDPEARAAASYCLEMVSSGPEGASAVLSCESNVLQKEVDMLEDPITTDEAQLSGVLTLTNCTTCDGGVYQALDAHVPPTLLRLAESEKSNDEMRIAIARCLRNMAHHPYGKVQVFEAGAIPVLTKFLQSDNELLQQCGAYVKPSTTARVHLCVLMLNHSGQYSSWGRNSCIASVCAAAGAKRAPHTNMHD